MCFQIVSTIDKRGKIWQHVQFCIVADDDGLRFPREVAVTALNHNAPICVPIFKQVRSLAEKWDDAEAAYSIVEENWKNDNPGYLNRLLEEADRLQTEVLCTEVIECTRATKTYEAALLNFPTGLKVKFRLHLLVCNKCMTIAAVSHKISAYLHRKYDLAVCAPDNLTRGISPYDYRLDSDDEFALITPELVKPGAPRPTEEGKLIGDLIGKSFRCKNKVSVKL